MKILYVTTFNQRLYDATGKNFVRHKTEGDLLIAYEDGLDKVIPHHRKFVFHNLETDKFLSSWLKDNEDIIPTDLGGTFEGEYKLKAKFNQRASQWFRKIVALNRAMDLKGYDAIVFLDSDTVISKNIKSSKVEEIFGGQSMFYHLGPYRKESGTGIESGVIGFNLNEQGGILLACVINKFRSGDFKNYIRWDDGYIFRMVVEENTQIPTRDLVNVRENDVVEHGPFAEFIVHEKGVHWKKHGMPSMKGAENPR